MAQHGGYRKPANPAPVSGPGVFSQRTDGRQPVLDLPNAGYGQNAQFRADEQGAAIPQSTPLPGGPSSAPSGPQGPPGQLPVGQDALNPPVPLTSGTLSPNVPVTDGAASGPGAGTDALNLPPDPVAQQHASALSLIQGLAGAPNASPAVRFLAQSLSGSF